MNTASKLLSLLSALPLLAVPSVAWAQRAPQLSEKVQQLADRDPAGGIMTFTAVLVVFLALAMLVIIFHGIGLLFQRKTEAPAPAKSPSQKAPTAGTSSSPTDEALVAISLALSHATGKPDEVAAAISLALQAELETQHDYESYTLTIRHRPTQWNARIQGTRAYKH